MGVGVGVGMFSSTVVSVAEVLSEGADSVVSDEDVSSVSLVSEVSEVVSSVVVDEDSVFSVVSSDEDYVADSVADSVLSGVAGVGL